MEADCGKNILMRICQLDNRLAGFQVKCWNQNSFNARIECALNNRVAICVEFVQIQMAMGVCKHW
jgi:hypothetical protein